MKVIPAIDIMGGSVVRLVKGDAASKVVYSNDPVETAKKWEAAGADMLHVVDLDAAFSAGSNSDAIFRIAEAVKIPVQAAGGIRSQEAAEAMLSKVSRIVIGTMAYTDQDVVRKLAKKNAGKVVISIDQSGGNVMVKGWKESAGVKVADAISQFRSIGIEEFLLTSIERDGTLQGPDMETLAEAARRPGARIIASGGISSVVDVIRVKSVGCSSVILGKAMYEGRISVEKAKAVA
jgi:phosphoribosylformimino-5-aminoimidazole carboxamide ribotide isomerase